MPAFGACADGSHTLDSNTTSFEAQMRNAPRSGRATFAGVQRHPLREQPFPRFVRINRVCRFVRQYRFSRQLVRESVRGEGGASGAGGVPHLRLEGCRIRIQRMGAVCACAEGRNASGMSIGHARSLTFLLGFANSQILVIWLSPALLYFSFSFLYNLGIGESV